MKFSVLLPTYNRLELLKYALETVLRQDYADWEVIISDNFSDQDIATYIQSIGDPRIKYFRTQSFVPVTENWNNALKQSAGDFVIMLGDDDCLMQGYFSTVAKLIEKYDYPDFIYTDAFLYAYPGVMPGFKNGFLQFSYARFFFGTSTNPAMLETTKAQALVKQSMNFKVSFSFNMQNSLINRRFIESIRSAGEFFQSPYPDYYASNVLFLTAKRILIYPQPIVTTGISPKSFGFYYFNDREDDGVKFLKNIADADVARRVEHVILPGTNMNTSWLLAMETISKNFGDRFPLRVNYARYRWLQLLHILTSTTKVRMKEAWKRLFLWEKLIYGGVLLLVYVASRLFPRQLRPKALAKFASLFSPHPKFNPQRQDGEYQNILEVFEQVAPRRD